MLTLGLIINPLAGIGGSVGLKGSDGADIVKEAFSRGAECKSSARAKLALDVLIDIKDQIKIITCPQFMGEHLVADMGFNYQVLENIAITNTSADDTCKAAQQLLDKKVDIILFAGGDGTARDICSVVADTIPVLGIPAGVKIHSAVYAVTPKAAGEVIVQLASGQLIDVKAHDVRDIDEEAFRNNIVRAKLYGEMRVPQAGQFIQSVKQGGVEVEELVLQDIAADIVQSMEDDVLYFIGSGKTTLAIMDELNLDNTLLGIDAIMNHELLQADVNEVDILSYLEQYSCQAVISIIGGQGHIIGRGNQQLSAKVLRKLGKENLKVISTKAKIRALEGRPLIVDSGDNDLDELFSGTIEVITGYQDQIIYPVGL
ncbi:MAG: ATP-NAD kinase family protein [Oleispira sp.]|nr:ATP-NAD kinase family protein [Oleispira sp.]